ncbi:MAG: CehA/McbA family metallohydrolase [Bradymonadaceae bacterium]
MPLALPVPIMHRSRSVLLAALLFAATFGLVGCSGGSGGRSPGRSDAATGDAGDDTDAGPLGPLERTPVGEGVSPDGNTNVHETLDRREARAGRIPGPKTGFEGVWAHCRPGDFKLYNSKIEVCIQDETTNRHTTYTGGKLVDANPVGFEGPDTLSQIMPLVALGTIRADDVRVVRDGSNGGEAVIRVTGRDVQVAQLAGVIGGEVIKVPGLEATVEYRLEPESRAVEMVTWLSSDSSGGEPARTGDWLALGDRARIWKQSGGFGDPDSSFHWVGAVAPGLSYGWVAADGPVSPFAALAGEVPWIAARTESTTIPGDGDFAWRRWFVVGDGTLESVRRLAHGLRGEGVAGTERTFRLETEGGDPLRRRDVTVRREGSAVTFGRTDDSGEFSTVLQDGSYSLKIESAPGRGPLTRSVEFPDGTARKTVTIPEPARANFTVRELPAGERRTARIVLRRTDDSNRTIERFAADGRVSVALAPGSYEATVMRGPEYTAETVAFEVSSGESIEKTVELERVLDTSGWLSGDFHQHMEPSIDSAVPIEKRVLENAGVGVEFAVPTDHDTVTSLADTIRELGIEDELATAPGVEVSPLEAHMNVYPMKHRPDEPGHGTIRLSLLEEGKPRKRTIPELVQTARSLPWDPVLQLNHPRRSSGFFNTLNYEPGKEDPTALEGKHHTLDFDTIEVINGFDEFCKQFADWSGLLNAGVVMTGLGNSDTHSLGGESGLPRNYLKTDASPDEVTNEDIESALRNHRVTVGGNAFIELSGKRTPGDVLATGGSARSFQVRVQTPPWAKAAELAMVVNGRVESTHSRSNSENATPTVDFDRTLSHAANGDSWVVFVAWGPSPSGKVGYNEPVLAFTNPIFLDADGDRDGDGQKWESPGVQTLKLSPLDPICN